MDELERRKIVGPAKGAEPRDILDLPTLESSATASAPAESATASEESEAQADALESPPHSEATAASAGVLPPPASDAATPLSKPGPPSPAIEALRWFYERLALVESDYDLLWKKRGLTPDTAEALGYKSNLKSNRELLQEMEKHFAPEVLLESGLWSQGDRPGDPAKPNAQFYGMSLVEKRDKETGKKIRNAEGEPVIEFVWGDPGAILIPYFDAEGDLIHLRPHKGMMRGKTPALYVARPSRAWRQRDAGPPYSNPRDAGLPFLNVKYAGITEGEFKAAAIYQVMGDECAVAAIPGITMVKLLFGDIEEWLEDMASVRQVFVGYDNEDKGNPDRPGYQEDKWRRFTLSRRSKP
jgi:hypothetical protein